MVDLTESIWSTQQSPSDRSGAEDSQAREGRSRRKLQKAQADHPRPFQRLNGNPQDSNDTQSKGTSRRRPSLRNHKAPMGARPLTRSPSKPSTTVDAPARSTRSTSLGIKNGPRPQQSSIANVPRVTLGNELPNDVLSQEDETQNAPFLPEVNFDDLHTSITGEPNLYDLAASKAGFGGSSAGRFEKPTRKDTNVPALRFTEKRDPSETRIGRSNSLLRKQSSTAPKSQTSGRPNASGNTEVPAAARTRRQSHFGTSASSNNLARAPRKSIGPGVLPHSASDYSFLKRDFSHNIAQSTTGAERTTDAGIGDRLSTYDSEDTSVNTNRTSRYKPSQTPKRNVPEPLHVSHTTPDNTWAGVSSGSSQSPLRNSHVGATTPSSAKRLSVMPGHANATGLGARTISPTDARRMKRMSIMQNAPPVPSTPPASLPDGNVFESKMASAIVSQIPRKVDTPTSNRTTPDPNRKSISSAISVSSNTSLSSFRPQNSNSTRTYQNIASSRLPTLKGRNEPVATGTEEGVPPVPAIPKAYESPKNEQDVAFAVARKSSLQFDATSSTSGSTNDYTSVASTNSSEKETPKPEREYKPRKSLTYNAEISEDRLSGAQNGRRTLQPIRLPPLNLLPLSAPTADKIAALGDNNAVEVHSPSTPPPKRGVPQTPSTPMTASKASFTRYPHREDSSTLPAHLRTSSSYYNLKSDIGHSRIPSGSVANFSGAIDLKPPRKAVSPYLSSSLPKSSGEFTAARSRTIGDRSISTVGVDSKPIRPTGPRAQTTGKPMKAEPIEPSGAFTDTEASSFGSTLRRKLSLTRKRSSSKAETERPPQPPDHEVMPPPKLPASATWTGPWHPNASPTQRPTYLHSRRKSTLTEGSTRYDRGKGDVNNANANTDQATTQVEAQSVAPATRIASGSIPASSKLSLASNHRGTTRLQAVSNELDKDDLVAEEEMKKLAHKRKSAENAAKELDDLKRRALPKDCVTPTQALRAARLNIFERGEIMDFKEIYFCGTQNANKIEGNAQASASNNFGYDDERGDYNIVLGDHLEYRYEVVDVLGKGSFGQVVRCIDHKTGNLVAIKIIRNKKRFHQQALVEVNILQKLREWDPENKYSMVNFTGQFYFRGHLCISTELLGINLYEFIKLHDFKGFSLKLIRRFTKQMLNSLVLLQSRKIIHCDLKPENILLAHPARSEIKVIDFGSSCHENERVYTYIQSRFYRSPEVILGMTYGMPIDMWSLGCILAELLTGYPVFPGENEQEQLACIMEVFGPPDKQLIEKATRKKLFFDSMGKPRLTVSSKGKRRRPSSKTLQQALKCDDEPFLDFLTKCLRWDPERRLKPDEAVHHEFITGVKQNPTRSLRPIPQATTGINTSPIKRFNSLHTPSTAVRPLPDPPTTALKNGVAVKPRDGLNSSPNKAVSKRHSTATAVTNGVPVASRKASGNTTNIGTVPKLEGKIATGGSIGRGTDLASAAAAAATTKTR